MSDLLLSILVLPSLRPRSRGDHIAIDVGLFPGFVPAFGLSSCVSSSTNKGEFTDGTHKLTPNTDGVDISL